MIKYLTLILCLFAFGCTPAFAGKRHHRAHTHEVNVFAEVLSFFDAPVERRSARKSRGRKQARSECTMNQQLADLITEMRYRFGSVRVTSVCGGRHARHSYHYRRDAIGHGMAVDFRIHGNVRAAAAFLRGYWPGGSHHYGGGLFHADLGPRRGW